MLVAVGCIGNIVEKISVKNVFESQAKDENTCLWADKNPVPQWEWRRRDKSYFAKSVDLYNQFHRAGKKIYSFYITVSKVFDG